MSQGKTPCKDPMEKLLGKTPGVFQLFRGLTRWNFPKMYGKIPQKLDLSKGSFPRTSLTVHSVHMFLFPRKKCAGLGSLPGFSSQQRVCVCSECNLNTHNFGILRSWPFLYCFLIFLQSFDHATLHVIVSRAKLSFSLGSHHHPHFRYH